MTSPSNVTPDAEVKWQAWLARGRAHDLRVRVRVRMFAFGLVIAGLLSLGAVVLSR
jgi:hypothetical protein